MTSNVCEPLGLPAPGPAMVVGWRAEPAASSRSWGEVIPASSELARQLGRVAVPQRVASTILDGGLTFRLALPEAFGAESLLHLTDGPDGPADGFGRAVLLPMAGPHPGAPVAGGPLGLLALTQLTEIAATGTQNRVLGEVTAAITELAPQCPTRLDDRLRAAEETLRGAQSALVDRALIPEDVAFGTAAANLSVLRHQTVAHIAGWERVAHEAGSGGTHGTALREALGSVGRLGWDRFPGAVHAAYQGLMLDGRRLLIAAVEQHLRTPDRPPATLRPLVEPDLTARAADITRLWRLLTRLSVTPLTVRKRSGAMLPNLIADQAAENARTQVLFTRMANALAAPGRPASGSYDLEIQTHASGDLQVLRPTTG